ncbi:MAG TPA: NACHT domain-containing protein [Trebonia sp.]|nr:NACHT domain-containing protein [Trebonia sp.]
MADKLAVAIDAQWSAEATVRRLNDPYPLPVSWLAADASLTDAWDSLEKLATSGAGWPAHPPAGTWAAGPDDLAGEGGELAEVLARVPTGRLVVLGEPGAGKTMLMVRLVLDLLARRTRTSGGPVPILASVASWNPAAQDLRDWLVAQLLIDHSFLAGAPPVGMTEPTLAAALLASGLILPVLDGLDEIPVKVRGRAISRINDALRPGEQVVVTCRTRQYRAAVRPKGGAEVTLRAAAAIQLHPLDADVVRDYLGAAAAGPASRARWDPVLKVLGTDAPAGKALRTPLMVGLACAIYNPWPGELARISGDPAELCSPALADRAAVESLLFDAFIPAAYRSDSSDRRNGSSDRSKAQDAERWLVFLAFHLEQTIGSPNLAWWQLHQALSDEESDDAGFVSRFVVGLIAGSTVGLVLGVTISTVAGIVVGLGAFVGGAASLTAQPVFAARSLRFGSSPDEPVRGVRLSVPWAVVGFALAFGFTLGARFDFDFYDHASLHRPSLGTWLVIAVGLGLAVAPISATRAVPRDRADAASPRAVLARDRKAALVLGVTVWLAAGVVVGIEAIIAPAIATGFLGRWDGTIIWVTFASLLALVILFGRRYIEALAWPSYITALASLSLRHRLPRRLMKFLADAHKRGVLRQVGAVYQFRHIELQHHLADRP